MCQHVWGREKDGAFVSVVFAQSHRGSKVVSLSILPFSLSMLYWEVSLLISDNVLEAWWWEMDNIKAGGDRNVRLLNVE